jgi:hypothetical protein
MSATTGAILGAVGGALVCGLFVAFQARRCCSGRPEAGGAGLKEGGEERNVGIYVDSGGALSDDARVPAPPPTMALGAAGVPPKVSDTAGAVLSAATSATGEFAAGAEEPPAAVLSASIYAASGEFASDAAIAPPPAATDVAISPPPEAARSAAGGSPRAGTIAALEEPPAVVLSAAIYAASGEFVFSESDEGAMALPPAAALSAAGGSPRAAGAAAGAGGGSGAAPALSAPEDAVVLSSRIYSASGDFE